MLLWFLQSCALHYIEQFAMSTFLYISDLVIRDYSVTLKILVTLNVNYSKPEKIE